MTIEQIAVLDDHTIVIGNDNNFPGSNGRTAGVPDDDEYAFLQVDQDLDVLPVRR